MNLKDIDLSLSNPVCEKADYTLLDKLAGGSAYILKARNDEGDFVIVKLCPSFLTAGGCLEYSKEAKNLLKAAYLMEDGVLNTFPKILGYHRCCLFADPKKIEKLSELSERVDEDVLEEALLIANRDGQNILEDYNVKLNDLIIKNYHILKKLKDEDDTVLDFLELEKEAGCPTLIVMQYIEGESLDKVKLQISDRFIFEVIYSLCVYGIMYNEIPSDVHLDNYMTTFKGPVNYRINDNIFFFPGGDSPYIIDLQAMTDATIPKLRTSIAELLKDYPKKSKINDILTQSRDFRDVLLGLPQIFPEYIQKNFIEGERYSFSL